MNAILIGYDLNRRGQDYEPLWEKIKSLGAWWHHLDSTWIVKTGLSASDVRDTLSPYIDLNDELLVINITGDAAAWKGFTERGGEWLRDNV